MSQSRSQCGACDRYISPFSPKNTAGLKGPFCAAFPDGIPEVIFHNGFDHRRPYVNDNDLQWTARGGTADFPTYAFAPEVLEGATIIAAADRPDEVHTGAMLALIPTADDTARLTIADGEPTSDLHCTLIFLGEAAELDDVDRGVLLEWAKTMAKSWPPVTGEAFAPSVFNPGGDEPCAVLVLSGAELAEFHETALADVSDLISIVDQHEPWIPHITLKYLENPTPADVPPFDLAGPVVFDRLRLAVGDLVTDITLGEASQSITVQRISEDTVAAAANEFTFS